MIENTQPRARQHTEGRAGVLAVGQPEEVGQWLDHDDRLAGREARHNQRLDDLVSRDDGGDQSEKDGPVAECRTIRHSGLRVKMRPPLR